ncbi:MAG: helix-turn-helix domain-containing protein [Pirellulaceae bacterium]
MTKPAARVTTRSVGTRYSTRHSPLTPEQSHVHQRENRHPEIRQENRLPVCPVICNDRADSFLGVQAEVCPRHSEVPCARDKRAHDLMCKGWNQRRIAAKLGCSQPTVQRGIRKYRLWFGTTLPEDREEITGFAKYRIAVEEHRSFLEHQKQLAMQEWRRSRQSVRKPGGKKAADQADQPVRRRNANVSHFNATTRLSLQLTMLQSGYLGVHLLACDMALDIDERDRWDRNQKSRDRVIEELTREVAELKEKLQSTLHAPREEMLGAGLRTPPTGWTVGLQGASGGDLRSGVSTGSETRAEPGEVLSRSEKSTILADELRTAVATPVLNQVSPAPQVVSPGPKAPCDDSLDSQKTVSRETESVNQSTLHARREEVLTRSVRSTILDPPADEGGREEFLPRKPLPTPSPPGPQEKRPRWDNAARQEALDYHCMIHGIPPLELQQVTGIPDPKTISPKMWMQRGYPYMIYSDRSIPSKREPVRDTRKVITVW